MTTKGKKRNATKRDQCCAVILVNKVTCESSTITYHDLADIVSGLCDVQILASRLNIELRNLIDFCAECNLPAISVMAVNKDTGVPGKKFFERYREVYGVGPEKTDIDILRDEHRKCVKCKNWKKLYKRIGLDVPAPIMK